MKEINENSSKLEILEAYKELLQDYTNLVREYKAFVVATKEAYQKDTNEVLSAYGELLKALDKANIKFKPNGEA
jgi:DNA-binding ferritin-like protein